MAIDQGFVGCLGDITFTMERDRQAKENAAVCVSQLCLKSGQLKTVLCHTLEQGYVLHFDQRDKRELRFGNTTAFLDQPIFSSLVRKLRFAKEKQPSLHLFPRAIRSAKNDGSTNRRWRFSIIKRDESLRTRSVTIRERCSTKEDVQRGENRGRSFGFREREA